MGNLELGDRLTQVLQQEADFFGVVVQVLVVPEQIYIYLNRPQGMAPDCPDLVPMLTDRLKNEFPEITTVTLISRV